MCWFLRPIHYRRWIFSCCGVAQHPDSPIPFAWVIRDYIHQDALLCKGREPEGSGGGWAFLQRRPREAFLWPPRDRPWQLRRCLLCTADNVLTPTRTKEKCTPTHLWTHVIDDNQGYNQLNTQSLSVLSQWSLYTVTWCSWSDQFFDPTLPQYLISCVPFCEQYRTLRLVRASSGIKYVLNVV